MCPSFLGSFYGTTELNSLTKKIRAGFTLFAFLLGSFSYPMTVQAAPVGYNAVIEFVNYPKELKIGETGVVVVKVKNTGTATWLASGKNYTSIYHWDPIKKVEKTSLLSTPAWKLNDQPVRLAQDLKPGASATLSFPIRPTYAGTFKESYSLTAENLARMKGGSFDVSVQAVASSVMQPISLVPAPVKEPVAIPASVATPVSNPQGTANLLNVGTKDGWSAALVSRGGSQWQLNPGEKGVLMATFKNTSQFTWKNNGANYLSLYSVSNDRKERVSLFATSQWIKSSQPVKMLELEVKPGQIGTFQIPVQAPMQPGFYEETFQLAAENMAWLGGGAVTYPINVPLTSAILANSLPNNGFPKHTYTVEELAAQKKENYMASLLLKSVETLKLLGNGSQQVTFGFKNAGSVIWKNHSVRLRGLQPATTQAVSLRDDTWLSAGEPVSVNAVTKPGELAFTTFKIKAPARKGTYTASFTLHADGQAVEGGDFDIPITVTADGYIEPLPTPTKVPTTPTNTTKPTTTPTPTNSSVPSINPIPVNGDESALGAEPWIRVGLFKPEGDSMTVAPMTTGLKVYLNGSVVCSVAIGQSVSVRYNRTNKTYVLGGSTCSGESTVHYQVRADDDLAPMQITSYNRPIAWLTGSNDNKFRARIELRFSPTTGDTWVINELPIEYYLRGIAETSNSSPQEFQRTLLTAARTYAMYHVQRQTKHASKFFYVDAELDQVYRGYASEARTPNVVAAVIATRAQVVTYNGQIAITPYFSNSDGRTRNWNEVWGGTSPAWIQSVPVPYDQGKTLWGHGVGMSASGAVGMARDGKTYDQILTYFFKNIELRKAYR